MVNITKKCPSLEVVTVSGALRTRVDVMVPNPTIEAIGEIVTPTAEVATIASVYQTSVA